jgi:hypothetical protein
MTDGAFIHLEVWAGDEERPALAKYVRDEWLDVGWVSREEAIEKLKALVEWLEANP